MLRRVYVYGIGVQGLCSNSRNSLVGRHVFRHHYLRLLLTTVEPRLQILCTARYTSKTSVLPEHSHIVVTKYDNADLTFMRMGGASPVEAEAGSSPLILHSLPHLAAYPVAGAQRPLNLVEGFGGQGCVDRLGFGIWGFEIGC